MCARCVLGRREQGGSGRTKRYGIAPSVRTKWPPGGLELVWNGLDGDATRVEVVIELSPMEAVEKVRVIDNGTGIAPEACDAAFERIGGSSKKMTRRTPGLNRFLHGSTEQGRLRGYALGDHIRWTTVADGIDGRRRTVIRASATTRNDFEISTSQPTDEPTGTVFEAWGKQSKRLDQLKTQKAIAQLTTELATYLMVYQDVEVIYDNHRIDPGASILRSDNYDLPFTVESGAVESAALRLPEGTPNRSRRVRARTRATRRRPGPRPSSRTYGESTTGSDPMKWSLACSSRARVRRACADVLGDAPPEVFDCAGTSPTPAGDAPELAITSRREQ